MAVSITKNADIYKNISSGYWIGFCRGTIYSVGTGFGRNLIIFVVDMSYSAHMIIRKRTY